tara:strand:- start:3946 stop:7887 length:3942 start_codon:yes stop_codon:yes gene_type:complete
MECVDAIQFGVMNNEEIKKLSVVEVLAHEIYDKGIPKPNSLGDLRMGTIDRQYICQTCHQNSIHCPGHFGHIELAEPVFHILFIKQLVKVLQCICLNCKQIIVPIDKVVNKSSYMFKTTHELCKNKNKCCHCEATKNKIILDKHDIYIDNGQRIKLIGSTVYDYVKDLPTNTLKALGFTKEYSHPKDFIIKNLLVPPPHVRPSVIMDASLKSQDDLTHKLTEIIKTNNQFSKIDKDKEVFNTLYELLQFHVTTYIDNGIPGIPQATQRTGRPLKAICQRLKSKEGRVRGNLMGKRVNFSARTVITAEPNIDLDQLGIPYKIAHNLTFPETVTNYNKSILQEYVNNGTDPEFGSTGAKFVIQNGISKDLRFVKNIEINIGDTVERHLKDNDLVIFNRQPSLHKMSMMGHRLKLMNNLTFRMNLSATNPYNADFDGDEMNIFVPQNYQTKAEIEELMMVSKHIVSPQSNKPVMGIIQDSLLGSHKLTLKSTFLDSDVVSNILCKLDLPFSSLPKPAILKPKKLWTGKQLLQLILPSEFNYYRKNALYDENDKKYLSDGEVIIKNGIHLYGNLCKKSLGTSEGSIVHILWLDYGHIQAKRFLSDLQYIVTEWLIHTGFSIGAMDIFVDKKTDMQVNEIMSTCRQKVNDIINLSKNSKLFDIGIYESQINNNLNNAMSLSGKAVKDSISLKNNINSTVTAGSKGSILNMAQIMGCVGQQNVNGKRVEMGYTYRVLPHFNVNDNGPPAKGFVKNSYKKGLEPHEFFYHAMGGREGIIDTAVKTSETGYIQRRLIKSMEDISIHYDQTVRNSIGDILQFSYGDDGSNAVYLFSETIPFITNFCNFTDYQRITLMKHYHDINMQKSKKLYSPIHLSRILNGLSISSNGCNDFEQWLIDLISWIYNKTTKYSSFKYIEILLLSIKNIYSKNELDIIETKVKHQFLRSRIIYGEMVGTLTAQSLGEPVTQLTLNTFHSAGISAKNVTLGVPRFKELINVAKNIKSPSMKIILNDESTLHSFASNIEYNTLNMYVLSTNIQNEIINEHVDWISNGLLSYCIKFTLNTNNINSKKIDLCNICFLLDQEYENNITSICTPDCIYVYIHEDALYDKEVDISEIRVFASKLKHTRLYGIKEIKRTFITDNFIETDGSCLRTIFNYPEVNYKETISNNIIEIKELLGIEAARQVLYNEIKNVLEFDGTYINNRHFLTLVDTMTCKGDIMAITRHGINRSEAGPLMKCSFEETVDVLCEAAQFTEKDLLKGVTENVTLGKLARMGTGAFDIFFQNSSQPTKSETSDNQYIDSFYEELDSEVESFFSDKI